MEQLWFVWLPWLVVNQFDEIFLLTLFSYPFSLLAKVWVVQNVAICLLFYICSNYYSFTFFTGLMLGCFCALFKTEAILIAVGLTCAVTVALTIFAFQTKIDFTTCGGMYNLKHSINFYIFFLNTCVTACLQM